MDRNQSDMAHKAFPAEPDRTALYPAAGQQRVLAALQQDIVERRHLLCLTGPAGSGKTVLLRALRKNLKQGLVSVIEQPTPGRLLADMARSLQLDASDGNESLLRRRLVMLLAMVDQQKQPIIQIVDGAERLSTEDLNLLLHFFPPGHATLVFASEQAPEAWLAGCTTATGEARIDQCYRLEPWSAEETAEYIRHRLRAASLPDDVFPPATLAAIHRDSEGWPGAINRVSAAALEQSSAQTTGQMVAPRPEPPLESAAEPELSPAIETEREVQQTEPEPAAPFSRIVRASRTVPDEDVPNHPVPNESVWADAGAAAHVDRRRREPTLRTVVPANEVNYEEGRQSLRTRRLRRSVRLWRAATVLAGVALVVALTQDIWSNRLSSDRFTVEGIIEQRREQSSAPGTAPESAAGDSQFTPADTLQPEHRSSDFAALQAPPSMREGGESVVLPGPRNSTAPPFTLPDAMPQTIEQQPQFKSAPPVESAPGTASAPAPQASRTAPARHQTDTATRETRSEGESPRLTRSQRREVARLYAERAEYEWRNGDMTAAVMSIQRGLASDPGNPRLLEMRAMLQGLTQEP